CVMALIGSVRRFFCACPRAPACDGEGISSSLPTASVLGTTGAGRPAKPWPPPPGLTPARPDGPTARGPPGGPSRPEAAPAASRVRDGRVGGESERIAEPRTVRGGEVYGGGLRRERSPDCPTGRVIEECLRPVP